MADLWIFRGLMWLIIFFLQLKLAFTVLQNYLEYFLVTGMKLFVVVLFYWGFQFCFDQVDIKG